MRKVIHEFGHVAGLTHDLPTYEKESKKLLPNYKNWNKLIGLSLGKKKFSEKVISFYDNEIDQIYGSSIWHPWEYMSEERYVLNEVISLEYLFRALNVSVHNKSNSEEVSSKEGHFFMNYVIDQNVQSYGFSSLFSTMSSGHLAFFKESYEDDSLFDDLKNFCLYNKEEKLSVCSEKVLRTINPEHKDPYFGFLRPADVYTLAEAYGHEIVSEKLLRHSKSYYSSDEEVFNSLFEALEYILSNKLKIFPPK